MKNYLLNKTSLFTLLTAGLLALAACQNPTGPSGPSAPNFTALDAAIDTAAALENETENAGGGGTVAPDKYWAAPAAHTTLSAAIAAAQSVRNTATEQSTVNTAVTTLNAAIAAFETARSAGTKSSGFDAADLTRLVDKAKAAKAGVVASTNGSDVLQANYWVHQDKMTALDNAITAAENADGGNIDSEYTTLKGAIDAFVAAKKLGTKVPDTSLTIKKLPASFADGSPIYVGLFTGTLNGTTPVIRGMGYVNGGEIMVELFKNQQPWTENGDYKVVFANRENPNDDDFVCYYSNDTVVKYTATDRRKTIDYSTGAYSYNGPTSLTVTNLPAASFANGSTVHVGLFQGTLSGVPEIMGAGTVNGGKVTVTLQKDGQPWTGTGDYKVIIANGMDPEAPGFMCYVSKADNAVTYTVTSRQKEISYIAGNYEIPNFGGSTDPASGITLRGKIGAITIDNSLMTSAKGYAVVLAAICRGGDYQELGATRLTAVASTTDWAITIPVQSTPIDVYIDIYILDHQDRRPNDRPSFIKDRVYTFEGVTGSAGTGISPPNSGTQPGVSGGFESLNLIALKGSVSLAYTASYTPEWVYLEVLTASSDPNNRGDYLGGLPLLVQKASQNWTVLLSSQNSGVTADFMIGHGGTTGGGPEIKAKSQTVSSSGNSINLGTVTLQDTYGGAGH